MSGGASDLPDDTLILHASCVAFAGRAVLIKGASGSGKSTLSLQLMGFGAELVSDDYTRIEQEDMLLVASSPPAIEGLIEARGVGILHAAAAAPTPVGFVIDMDCIETERLPPPRSTEIRNVTLPLLHKVEAAHFPAAIMQYLRAGRRDPI